MFVNEVSLSWELEGFKSPNIFLQQICYKKVNKRRKSTGWDLKTLI